MRPVYRCFALLFPVAALLTLLAAAPARAGAATRDWTFLVYVSGVNNLDPYGGANLNQMERVGSSDRINVVAQWASERAGTARRLRIEKDDDLRNVTSPVLEEFAAPDMGDWRTLVEFIRWGVERFPARHYFIAIWGHGSGWHAPPMPVPFDISPDDRTGRSISTRELGLAMREAARLIGRKVDLYGSDACLMSMLEIGTELMDSVGVFAGSQATEPGDGWPYADFLARWTRKPESDAREVARLLVESYISAYSGGELGKKEATFSALDLERLPPLLTAFNGLSDSLQGATGVQKQALRKKLRTTLKFSEPDYLDLGGVLNAWSRAPEALPEPPGLGEAYQALVIANGTTPRYRDATGVSLWVPLERDRLEQYAREYGRLRFQARTRWGDALRSLLE